MARHSVLSDVQQFSFTSGNSSVDFDAFVVDWGDFRRPRLAFHEYLKRDGAEAEYMGRAPHETKLTVVYLGPTWRSQLLEFQALVDANPIGTLIHPFYGQMPMACTGFESVRVSVESGVDAVTVPVGFKESSLNRALVRDRATKGPAFWDSQATATANRLQDTARPYTSAASSVVSFASAVATYTQAAVATTLSGGGPDPTLPTQLATVVTLGLAVRNAIRSDRAATNDVQVFAAISLTEQAIDQCEQLSESLQFVKPALQPWQVPAQTTLMALAQAFYGRYAAARLDEIRANNVGKISNPAAVAAGTTLMLAPPTVPQ